MALFGSYIGFQFIGTLYLQSLLGWSSLHTAFAFLPAGVFVVLASTRIAPVINRFGTPKLLVVAFAVLTAGYALFLRLGADASYVTLLLPTMLLLGLAFGIGFPSLNVQATSGVADDEQGLASGLLNTSFQLGGAIGLAIITAVVTSHTGTGTGDKAVLDGFRPGIAVATGIASARTAGVSSRSMSERRSRAVLAEDPDDFGPADEEFALGGSRQLVGVVHSFSCAGPHGFRAGQTQAMDKGWYDGIAEGVRLQCTVDDEGGTWVLFLDDEWSSGQCDGTARRRTRAA